MSRTERPSDTVDESAQPFAGVLVIEFGQFVAVPFCAQLLAEGDGRSDLERVRHPCEFGGR